MRRAILLFPAALGGCNLAPRYEPPVVSIPPAYPVTEGAAKASVPVAATVTWEDFFTEPRLRALVATALQRNRDLAQSYARVAQARARYRVQATDRNSQRADAGKSTFRQTRKAHGDHANHGDRRIYWHSDVLFRCGFDLLVVAPVIPWMELTNGKRVLPHGARSGSNGLQKSRAVGQGHPQGRK